MFFNYSKYIGIYVIVLINLVITSNFSLAERYINTSAKYVYLMDYDTGRVLLEKASKIPTAPASMSKLMTIYMAFEALKQERISLDTELVVSENAWRKKDDKGNTLPASGSTMFLEPLTKVSFEDLLRGIIVQSGNDACIVISEALSGSEEGFANDMNQKAKLLNLNNSNFTNSTGWPHKDHKMSSRDLAILSQKLYQDFPEYMHYFSETKFTYNGITQSNRNPILYQDIGGDGLKTGYTKSSGHGVVASAVQNNRRLILVLNGIEGTKLRAVESERILNWGFREFENKVIFEENEIVDSANVWLGNKPNVPLIVKDKVYLSISKADKGNDLKAIIKYVAPLMPPLEPNVAVGKLIIKKNDGTKINEYNLYPESKVNKAGPLGRLFGSLSYLIWGQPSE
tara:strand:- start:267 stop:1463 length:1197 start_codon:yes stop_codon:yes gene_type:complete